ERTLDRAVEAAGKVRAVALSGVRPARGFVHLENENAAGIRAIDHPQSVVLVVEGGRVDHVRMHGRVVTGDRTDAITAGRDLIVRLSRPEECPKVRVRPFDAVGYGDAQVGAREIAQAVIRRRAMVVIKIPAAVVELYDVRCP